jgi:hypothetical protein
MSGEEGLQGRQITLANRVEQVPLLSKAHGRGSEQDKTDDLPHR